MYYDDDYFFDILDELKLVPSIVDADLKRKGHKSEIHSLFEMGDVVYLGHYAHFDDAISAFRYAWFNQAILVKACKGMNVKERGAYVRKAFRDQYAGAEPLSVLPEDETK